MRTGGVSPRGGTRATDQLGEVRIFTKSDSERDSREVRRRLVGNWDELIDRPAYLSEVALCLGSILIFPSRSQYDNRAGRQK